MLVLTALLALVPFTSGLSLSVASSGGNTSHPLQYGLLYEDIYHSGDGGLYAELIRNRAFQGSASGQSSSDRTTDYWHPVGGVTLSIDTSTPVLSDALPYHMRIDVPEGTTGTVGFYNDGFWGFGVDASKRYISSLYLRGNYNGAITTYFQNTVTGDQLSSASVSVAQQSSDGWLQHQTHSFYPTASATDANNTFYYTFDGTQLAGQSIYVNLLSTFKQTYNNRNNGLREDLAQAVLDIGASWIRLPGGNNMEGSASPWWYNYTKTIGSLVDRPGRPGTWGDINTDGFGILEQMQMAQDLGLTVVLGVWAGLYLDGEIIAEGDLGPYIDNALDYLEFLTGDSSTPQGAIRASLGYTDPFTVDYVEIGNEDYLNGGTASYNSYRFINFFDAIRAEYPDLNLISTINPNPSGETGISGWIDLHIYDGADAFVSLFGTFDQASRDYPVFVGEYAAIRPSGSSSGQVGAQTFSMTCAEAIFLLGAERNSDVIWGTSYGALIKDYVEQPETVALIKHTPNEIQYTNSFYLQQLFAANQGTATLPVTADGNFNPVYWSATTNGDATIVKLVNYDGTYGSDNAVTVSVEDTSKTSGTLTVLTAPSGDSVNELPSHGGDTSSVTTSTITGSGGQFTVEFTAAYQIVVLTI